MNSVYIFLLLNIICCVQSAKILAVFPSPGYSQFILGEQLMLELIRRGHEVTVISPYKPKNEIKNYRPILMDGILTLFQGADLYQQDDDTIFEKIMIFEKYGVIFTEYILSHPEVQKLIHSNETFDLVLVEQFIDEALLGLAPHFNAPLISFLSVGLCENNAHYVGNIRPPSVNPLMYSPYSDRMSFFGRLHNAILIWFDRIYREYVCYPQHQELLDKYFPKKIKLEDAMYNVSIILTNSHASTTYPATITTAIKEIGGFHISPKKLPNNIQKYLDEATDGAIFFSMGTNLKSADIPRQKLEGILRAFSKLKQRVLWKFEATDIPNKPENVLISKWMPQSDILGHPNIVAFVTHGGLLSTTEAVHYGVPMVAVPVFYDQKMNVAESVDKQIAVHIPFKELSEKTLSAALKEVLTNPVYLRNIKQLQSVLNDQIAKPMDLAMFWIEYVIRHRGAPFFKNASLELYWFQLYMLDVSAFLILCVAIFLYAIKLLVRRILLDINKKLHLETSSSKQKTN